MTKLFAGVGWETEREIRVAEGYAHIQPLNISQQEWRTLSVCEITLLIIAL